MTTTVDLSPAERMRTTAAAVRIHFEWFGVRRSVEADKKDAMAESVRADKSFVSASKKILNNRSPAFKKLSSIRQQIRSYWRGMTLPYTEPGIRLIRQDWIEDFSVKLAELRDELNKAVDELEEGYAALRAEAQTRLGNLYNPADYPERMKGLFSVDWDFPSLEPPAYLMKLNPALYEQEKARISQQFEEAVRLGEQAFVAELQEMVKRMADSLETGEDGKVRKFHSSTVNKFGEFFERFKNMSVSGNADLNRIVEQAQALMGNVSVDSLRGDGTVQTAVRTGLSQIGEALQGMVVVAPRRRLMVDEPEKKESA